MAGKHSSSSSTSRNKTNWNSQDLKTISNELRFNLTEDDIKEVIHNVAGYEADTIPDDKFEKYLARKIQRRHAEMDLLK
jgi:hypothetical protein